MLRFREGGPGGSGGSGGEVLVLLHGLGATGDIWVDPTPAWPGRWLAPDLPGHGGSSSLATYTFAAMADRLGPLLKGAESVTVLGHSLGGVVGLELAARDERVRRVVGVGIKVGWTPDELAWARSVAARPVAWFDSREAAVARHRKVAGLGDLVDDEVAAKGVVATGGRWRLALDPFAFAVGAPQLRGLLPRTSARVTLARGEHDRMVSEEDLGELVPDPVTLPGLGHNAHLEDPAAVYALIQPPASVPL